MSKQDEITERKAELVRHIENDERNIDIVTEFSKRWDCEPRTVENYIALARLAIG